MLLHCSLIVVKSNNSNYLSSSHRNKKNIRKPQILGVYIELIGELVFADYYKADTRTVNAIFHLKL